MPLINTEDICVYAYCYECDEELSTTVSTEIQDNGEYQVFVSVTPCSCDIPDCDDAWQDGYSDGKDEGYSEGFDDGKVEGFDEANCVGKLIRRDINELL